MKKKTERNRAKRHKAGGGSETPMPNAVIPWCL